MKIKILTMTALAVTGFASAQNKQQKLQVQVPEVQLPEQVITPAGKQPQLDGVLKAETARAAGCISHQVYNVQGLSRISTAFILSTSSGDQKFNFEPDAIRHIPDGASLPLASTGETNRWDRVLTTLERAAAANKPLLVDYKLPGREVYGIHVQWSGNCAP